MKTTFCIIFGITLWTLVEYFLHRFGGHEWKKKKNPIFIPLNFFYKEHSKHHYKRGFFGANKDKLKASLAFIIILFLISYPLLQTLNSIALTLSFTLAYLYYEFFHRLCHVSAPKTFYGRVLRKHHFYHHFVNDKKNHGVTTRFWDRIFGTYVKTDQVVPIHQKFAMHWLEANQKKYEKDYIIVTKTNFT